MSIFSAMGGHTNGTLSYIFHQNHCCYLWIHNIIIKYFSFTKTNPVQWVCNNILKALINFDRLQLLPVWLVFLNNLTWVIDVQQFYKERVHNDHAEVTLNLLFSSHRSSGGWCHTLRRPSMFHWTDLHNHKNSGKWHKKEGNNVNAVNATSEIKHKAVTLKTKSVIRCIFLKLWITFQC